jgi:ribonuclease BN (tRNA processing enzyme)
MSRSQLKVLGCSGGFGKGHATTSFLIDGNILIDCGTGVGTLELTELKLIDHIFLTHCHLDHIVSLPFLLDLVGVKRSKPIQVYANPYTIKAIQENIMNNQIWPDFTKIPSATQPSVSFIDVTTKTSWEINGKKIRHLTVPHTVDALAYVIESQNSSIAFSGDTGYSESLIHNLNEIPKLNHLIIETSFSDDEKALAEISQHLCPELLAEMLLKLKIKPQIYITHLKPGHERSTLKQIQSQCNKTINPLKMGQTIIF